MPRNWQTLISDEDFSDVMRLVHLAMRQDSVNEEATRAALLKARRREYEQTLTELAKESGCNNQGRLGEGDILSEFNDISKQDAQSIVNTYNYELGIAIVAIHTETPTANRHVYAKRLRTWEENRAKHKEPQIAEWTNLSARQRAQQDFSRFNNVEGTVRLLGPDPAKEPICQGALNRGRVTLREANSIAMPAHLRCPHTWGDYKIKRDNQQECSELWMGQ